MQVSPSSCFFSSGDYLFAFYLFSFIAFVFIFIYHKTVVFSLVGGDDTLSEEAQNQRLKHTRKLEWMDMRTLVALPRKS